LGYVDGMEQTFQSAAVARRLISFRVDDDLAVRLDQDLERAREDAAQQGFEVSEAEYFRMLFRRALDIREAERGKRKRK
jgi:hypothetical protein